MHCIRLFPGLVIGYSKTEDGPIASSQQVDALIAPHVEQRKSVLPIHEHGVQCVEVADHVSTIPTADILLTSSRSIVLAHQFADCVPLVVFDPHRRAVVFAHAGWRGLVQGAVQISLLSLLTHTGSDRSECWLWIGPCIHQESYILDTEPVQARFPLWKESLAEREGKYYVDLPGYIRRAAIAAGMDERKILQDDGDTYAHPELFFSHTRYKQTRDVAHKGNFVVVCWLE